MQPPRYDPLIAGGRVLDPGQGIDALTDVAVAGDRIVLIEKAIDGTRVRRVLDATGLLVVPGLVDLHTHVTAGQGSLPTDPLAVTPDIAGVFSGVTTVVDAGTAGSANAAGFVDHVAAGARTRVIGFLNAGTRGIQHAPEAREPADMDVSATVAAIRARPGVHRGSEWWRSFVASLLRMTSGAGAAAVAPYVFLRASTSMTGFMLGACPRRPPFVLPSRCGGAARR